MRHLDRLKSILLEDAYRAVTINDPNGQLKMPMVRAVVRSIAHNAVKGNPRAQRLFTNLIQATERDGQQLHDERLQLALEYKVEWEHELEGAQEARHHRPRAGAPIRTTSSSTPTGAFT